MSMFDFLKPLGCRVAVLKSIPTSVEGRIRIAEHLPLFGDVTRDIGWSGGCYIAAETKEEQKAWLNRLIRLRETSHIKVI
jgi:hypothetical protein